MFYLEVASPSRMTEFRRDLLVRLNATDALEEGIEKHASPPSKWLPGWLGAASSAVGLTAAEIGHWSAPGFVVLGFGFAGLVAGLVLVGSPASFAGFHNQG
jgi:hypothetical protein